MELKDINFDIVENVVYDNIELNVLYSDGVKVWERKQEPQYDVFVTYRDTSTSGYTCPINFSGNKFIKNGVFTYDNTITDITINADVVSIEYRAFDSCSGLRNIHFNGNTNINDSAFAFCSSLNMIEFNGNEYYEYNKEELWQAFADNGVYVADNAFDNTPFQKPSVLEDNEVNEYDYYNVILQLTDGTYHYYNFDGGYIPENRFEYRGDIVYVTICAGLGEIKDFAFAECNSLQSVWILSSDLTNIGSHAFYDCYSLNQITIDNTESAPQIASDAFEQIYWGGTISYGSGFFNIYSTDWNILVNNYGWNTEDVNGYGGGMADDEDGL